MDGNKIKMVSHSFILMCYFIFSSYMGNNQCYLLVVLPGITSGLLLVVRNALVLYEKQLSYNQAIRYVTLCNTT